MRPLMTAFSFLVLTVLLPVHSQTRGFDVDRVASFFHNDSLPVSCNVHIGVDWYGGDIISAAITDIRNPGECCAFCEERLGCRAWLWRSDVNHCWLKQTVSRPQSLLIGIGGIFHDGKAILPAFIREICNQQEGRSLNGPNLEVRIGTTVGDYCNACILNQNCIGWTLKNTNSPRCFLKQRNEGETDCKDCISGINEERNRPIDDRCNVEEGIDWPGTNMGGQPYTNTSAAGCCDICGNLPACRAWVYHNWTHECYVKSGLDSEFECQDCIGGLLR